MKILVLDTEHSYGAFRPWQEGFYLACVGAYSNYGFEKLWWFDHCEYDGFMHEKPNFKQNAEEIQYEIDQADLIVFHNTKHDTSILRYYGIDIPDTKSHCTMLTEYLLAGQSRRRQYNLGSVATRYGETKEGDEVQSYWDRGIDTYDIPADILGKYCLQDCRATYVICINQRKLVLEMGMDKLVDLQNEFTHALVDMENNGFVYDHDRGKEIHAEYLAKCNSISKDMSELMELEHLNMDSTQQLAAICFGGELKMKWTEPAFYKNGNEYNKHFSETVEMKPIWKVKDDDRSTERKRLESLPARTKLQRKVKLMLITYSEVKKVATTILNKAGDKGLSTKVQTDGKIHPSFNQTIARTGRLTSSDPNSQNLPRDGTSPIKEVIIPSLDKILQWDLSQIEWRAAAFLSQDKNMMDEIIAGVDQHINACVHWMELPFVSKKDSESKKNRTDAKIFNFRMIYGGSAYGFFMDIKMPPFTLPKWQSIEEMFYSHYWGLRKWHDKLINECSLSAEYVLPTGKRFVYFKELRDGTEYNENQFKNYPVQGLAGDILYLAAVIIRRGMRKANLLSKLILTVHDSIVFDAKEDEIDFLVDLCTKVANQLPKYIEAYFGFKWNVPLEGECEVGDNYGQLEEVTV